jgi:hypothetical protein
MGQRTIVSYLSKKRLTAVAIYGDLKYTFNSNAISYSAITCYFYEVGNLISDSSTRLTDLELETDDYDLAILLASDNEPFILIQLLGNWSAYQDR